MAVKHRSLNVAVAVVAAVPAVEVAFAVSVHSERVDEPFLHLVQAMVLPAASLLGAVVVIADTERLQSEEEDCACHLGMEHAGEEEE